MEVKELGWKIQCDDVEWIVLVYDYDDDEYACIESDFTHMQLDKSNCEMLLEFIPKIMEARGWK